MCRTPTDRAPDEPENRTSPVATADRTGINPGDNPEPRPFPYGPPLRLFKAKLYRHIGRTMRQDPNFGFTYYGPNDDIAPLFQPNQPVIIAVEMDEETEKWGADVMTQDGTVLGFLENFADLDDVTEKVTPHLRPHDEVRPME